MFFRAEGVKYAPDVVMLVFNVANDVGDNSQLLNTRLYAGHPEKLLPKTYFHLDADGEPRPDAQPVGNSPPNPGSIPVWNQIENRLYLLRALRRLAARVTPTPLPMAVAPSAPATLPAGFTVFDVTQTSPDPDWSYAWRVTEALLRTLRRDVEQSGARFVVAVLPGREAVSPVAWQNMVALFPALRAGPHDPQYPIERITAFLEREGIPYLNLLPSMRTAAERTGRTGFYSWDVHLDVGGHAVVAESLAPFVAGLVTSN
jgi:hypothetical protein